MTERISRRTVKRWLDEWDFIICDGPLKNDAYTNSGCRPIDGITTKRLNKIILQEAYAALPLHLKSVTYYRWVKPRKLMMCLQLLRITKDQYYYRCDRAVTFIYHYLNGDK